MMFVDKRVGNHSVEVDRDGFFDSSNDKSVAFRGEAVRRHASRTERVAKNCVKNLQGIRTRAGLWRKIRAGRVNPQAGHRAQAVEVAQVDWTFGRREALGLCTGSITFARLTAREVPSPKRLCELRVAVVKVSMT